MQEELATPQTETHLGNGSKQSGPQDVFQKGGLQGINSPFEESWVNSSKSLVVLPSSQTQVTFVHSFILQRSMQTFIFYK